MKGENQPNGQPNWIFWFKYDVCSLDIKFNNVFLILPIILLIYLFSVINDIRNRVRNIESILMEKKGLPK